MTPETEQKILSYIDSEWAKFLAIYRELSPLPDHKTTIAALKAGFYSGFRAGAIAMHDAEKIL